MARFLLGVPEDTSALLATAATILLGAPLIWVAILDLARGHMHMNELVALASIASLIRITHPKAMPVRRGGGGWAGVGRRGVMEARYVRLLTRHRSGDMS